MLDRLRRATRDVHDRLDRSLGLMNESLDRATYVAVLMRLHGLWSGWEVVAANLLTSSEFGEERRRLPLIEADLAVLGLTSAEIRGLPICPPVPLRSRPEAIGAMYVMEGSSLGGKAIQRQVEQRLGLCAECGCRYFHGYGPRTGAMWRAVLGSLAAVTEREMAETERGAVFMFRHVSDWLSRIDARAGSVNPANSSPGSAD